MSTTKDLLSLIKKTPGVCGGDACIRNTRIMVWLLVAMKKEGLTEQRILEGYPQLTVEDLAAAWEYYRHHPQEIEEAIVANDGAHDERLTPMARLYADENFDFARSELKLFRGILLRQANSAVGVGEVLGQVLPVERLNPRFSLAATTKGSE